MIRDTIDTLFQSNRAVKMCKRKTVLVGAPNTEIKYFKSKT